jgi:hypothetical protein
MKKNDLKLIGICLAIGIIFFLATQLFGKQGASVTITVDNQKYATYSLLKDTEVEITGKYGTNHLVIKNHKAYVTEASCPDKLCVHQKAISKTGESIVCLPNKMVATVENSESNDLDAISK